jgi:hypothetical protein
LSTHAHRAIPAGKTGLKLAKGRVAMDNTGTFEIVFGGCDQFGPAEAPYGRMLV